MNTQFIFIFKKRPQQTCQKVFITVAEMGGQETASSLTPRFWSILLFYHKAVKNFILILSKYKVCKIQEEIFCWHEHVLPAQILSPPNCILNIQYALIGCACTVSCDILLCFPKGKRRSFIQSSMSELWIWYKLIIKPVLVKPPLQCRMGYDRDSAWLRGTADESSVWLLQAGRMRQAV